MKFFIGSIACLLITCTAFVGCDLGFLPSIDFSENGQDGQESVTLSDTTFENGEADSGLTVMEVTNDNLYYVFQRYGISSTGVIIIESRNSSDLKLGDKITHIDGVKVGSADEVNIIFKGCNVGDVVTVSIERNGKALSVKLTLTEKVPDSVSFG